MSTEKNGTVPGSARGYIIALTKWRSVLALIACLITVTCTLYAVGEGIVRYMRDRIPLHELFEWFTINSNFLTAFGASAIIPFAVEGIRKKQFSYPKWAAMLHYSGMVCTTLTMVFTVAFISWAEPEMAFTGYNFYLHVICPVMVIAAFFLVEGGFRYTRREAVMACIPTFLYGVIYTVEVVLIGKENGGWADMYHLTEYLPYPVSVTLAVALALGISLLLRYLSNRRVTALSRRMAARLWPPDVQPTEINIEIFGLGRYMGKHADMKFVEMPLDLIRFIAERYGMSTEQLTGIYLRGFLDSLKEREAAEAGKAAR